MTDEDIMLQNIESRYQNQISKLEAEITTLREELDAALKRIELQKGAILRRDATEHAMSRAAEEVLPDEFGEAYKAALARHLGEFVEQYRSGSIPSLSVEQVVDMSGLKSSVDPDSIDPAIISRFNKLETEVVPMSDTEVQQYESYNHSAEFAWDPKTETIAELRSEVASMQEVLDCAKSYLANSGVASRLQGTQETQPRG